MPSKRSSSNPRRFASKRSSLPKRRRRVVTSLRRCRANSFISRQAERSFPREVPPKPRLSRKRIRSGGTSPTGISLLARSVNRDCISAGQSTHSWRMDSGASLTITPATRSTTGFVTKSVAALSPIRRCANEAARIGTPPVQFASSLRAGASTSTLIDANGSRKPFQSSSTKQPTRSGVSKNISQKSEVRESSLLQSSRSLPRLPVTSRRLLRCASTRILSQKFLVMVPPPRT